MFCCQSLFSSRHSSAPSRERIIASGGKCAEKLVVFLCSIRRFVYTASELIHRGLSQCSRIIPLSDEYSAGVRKKEQSKYLLFSIRRRLSYSREIF